MLTAQAASVRAQDASEPVAVTTITHSSDSLSDTETAAPPAYLLDELPDWERYFANVSTESATPILVDEWPSTVVYGLMLAPGDIHLVGSGDETLAKIEEFRRRHPAVGAGIHEQLVNRSYTFQRTIGTRGLTDRVVIVLGAEGRTAVNVSRVFEDDVMLRDAMTDQSAFVSFGMATFDAHPSGVILIEEIR